MNRLNLFTSPVAVFSGFQSELQNADYVIVGVPFDATSTYRPGSRFAPLAVREASLNIETYSFRSGIDVEELKVHDSGDLHISGNVGETLRRMELVAEDLMNSGKIPVFIGGEHTITLGAVKGIHKNLALLSFDAHLDLRNEYMEQSLCHATVMRRIRETIKPSRIVEVGTRAVCREEIAYAKDQDIAYVTSLRIMQNGLNRVVKEINLLLGDFESVYLTVDMDVLDPSFAPAVGNPEPDGLSTRMLLDLLSEVCSRRIVGFDVVEVTPHYDTGVTSIQAAKIIFEILCHIHKDKKM